MSDADEDYDLGSQPHDAFFKETFSDPKRAGAFFESQLPSAITGLVDLRTLKVLPGSFVKSTLQQAHSDLLFTVKMGKKRDLFLYLLFEHQTTVDRAMPLRLHDYQNEIFQKHFDRKEFLLPPVISFVLHQGPDRWTVSRSFENLYDLTENEAAALMDYLPKFQYLLLDLSQVDPKESEIDVELKVILSLMKMARENQLLEFFKWLVANIDEWSLMIPDPRLRRIFLYALNADSNLDVETISEKLSTKESLKESMSSVAQQLIARGKAEGKAEGEAKGKATGELYGKIKLLEQFLGRSESSSEKLSELSLEELTSTSRELEKEYRLKFKDD